MTGTKLGRRVGLDSGFPSSTLQSHPVAPVRVSERQTNTAGTLKCAISAKKHLGSLQQEQEAPSSYCSEGLVDEEPSDEAKSFAPQQHDSREKKKYKCTLYSKEYVYQKGLNKHMRVAHNRDSSRHSDTSVEAADESLLPSDTTTVRCKLLLPKTRKPYNKSLSTGRSEWNLKQHQDRAQHHPEWSKKFRCTLCKCKRLYANSSSYAQHMKDKHGIGKPRAAEFSDEESDCSSEE